MRHNLEDAIYGVAGARSRIHFLFHARFSGGVDAGQHHFVFPGERGDLVPRRVALQFHAAHANHVAGHLDAQSRSMSLAKAPAATRAVDSRAEARSST